MHLTVTILSLTIVSISLVVCLACGWLLWQKRQEPGDRSRTILAVISLAGGLAFAYRIMTYIADPAITPYYDLLSPFHLLAGLAMLTIFIMYPIEVMRPRWLNALRTLLLFMPAVVAAVLFALTGSQPIQSLSHLGQHLTDLDVVIRLSVALCIAVLTCLLLLLPYNWRESSADNGWVRRCTLIMLVTILLFYGQLLTRQPLFHYLHLVWFSLSLAYFTYFELRERVMPVPFDSNPQQDVPFDADAMLWRDIRQVMDSKQMWRDPNLNAEVLSAAVFSNRSYVGQCVRRHTGLAFNEYISRSRVEYMADQLRRQPEQDVKTLVFAAGFRSRATAWRNFVKYMGCPPTEYAEHNQLKESALQK